MLNKTIVVKLGGSTLGGNSGHASPSTVLPDLLHLLEEGAQVILVHGGGKAINQLITQMGGTPAFKNGLRVTDPTALQAALMTMRGQINPALVDEFNRAAQQHSWPGHIPQAIGFTGIDGSMVVAERETSDGDIGLVGRITEIHLEPLLMALEWGYVPIIAPFGVATEAQPEGGYILNINADNVAAHIAAAIEADFCVFLTDVPGILDNEKQTIPRLDPAQLESLIKRGVVTGGMIPKVRSALTALTGSKFVAILDGNQPEALYHAVTSYDVAGTLLVNRDELEYSLRDHLPRDPAISTPPYPIQPATQDVEAVGELLHKAYEHTPDFAVESKQPGGFSNLVADLQAGQFGTYVQAGSLIALDGDKVIGATLVIQPERSGWEKTALLTEIAVHPDYQKQGLGRALLQRVLDELEEAGYEKIRLHVTRGNESAYHLYVTFGFVSTNA